MIETLLKPNKKIKKQKKVWGARVLISKSTTNCLVGLFCAPTFGFTYVCLFVGRLGDEGRSSSPLTCGCPRPPWTEETGPPSSPLLPLRPRCRRCCPGKPPCRTSGPRRSSYLEEESGREFQDTCSNGLSNDT